jgi:hypothetical protein
MIMIDQAATVSARARERFRARALMCLLGALLLGSCSRLAYRSRIEEFQNPDVPATRFTAIAVLPVDPGGFDPGIAARVRDNLKREGVNVVSARVMLPESEVSMPQLCPKDDPPEYQGVLWVAFDRIILRDCESTAVAYRAIGGYSGVDALAKRLVLYLRTSSATTTTGQ